MIEWADGGFGVKIEKVEWLHADSELSSVDNSRR